MLNTGVRYLGLLGRVSVGGRVVLSHPLNSKSIQAFVSV